MIAVDTNLLGYAHRQDSPHHAQAWTVLGELAGGSAPWPLLHEFLAVVTHPRIYRPPTSQRVAVTAVAAPVGLPHLQTLAESAGHVEILARLVAVRGVVGPRVHDARIAAICLGHGVRELWSADRDFTWFPELRVVNPLVGPV